MVDKAIFLFPECGSIGQGLRCDFINRAKSFDDFSFSGTGLTDALYERLGIDAGLTTAYHPQANGQVERKNQEVEAYLRLFIGKQQDDWVDLLPTAEFVINSQLNSATGHTPFELLYGYMPDFTIPAGRPTGIPLVDKHLQHLRSLRIDAEAALHLSKERTV